MYVIHRVTASITVWSYTYKTLHTVVMYISCISESGSTLRVYLVTKKAVGTRGNLIDVAMWQIKSDCDLQMKYSPHLFAIRSLFDRTLFLPDIFVCTVDKIMSS